MDRIKGVVKFYDFCNRCKSQVPVCVHKAVATMDILHAFLAKDVKCDLLLTFDKGFKELVDHEKLEPLEIVVL